MNPAAYLKTLRTLRRRHGKPAKGAPVNLTPAQVVERWEGAYSVGTLANWRAGAVNASGEPWDGPNYVKVAGRVLYPIAGVEKFEAAKLAEIGGAK